MVNKPLKSPYIFLGVGWLAMTTSHFNFVDKSPLPHENGYIMRSKCLSKINPFPDEDSLQKLISFVGPKCQSSRGPNSLWIFPCFRVCWRVPEDTSSQVKKNTKKKHFWRAHSLLGSFRHNGWHQHWSLERTIKCQYMLVIRNGFASKVGLPKIPWQWFILEGNHWF